LKFINENKFNIYYISIIRFRPRKTADLAAFSYVWACLGRGIEEDGIFAQFLAKGKTKKKKIGPVFFLFADEMISLFLRSN